MLTEKESAWSKEVGQEERGWTEVDNNQKIGGKDSGGHFVWQSGAAPGIFIILWEVFHFFQKFVNFWP